MSGLDHPFLQEPLFDAATYTRGEERLKEFFSEAGHEDKQRLDDTVRNADTGAAVSLVQGVLKKAAVRKEVAGITAALGAGLVQKTRAPKKASFTKKAGAGHVF